MVKLIHFAPKCRFYLVIYWWFFNRSACKHDKWIVRKLKIVTAKLRKCSIKITSALTKGLASDSFSINE